MQIFAIGVLLLILFVLLLFGKVAKTRRMFWVFNCAAIAILIVAMYLARENDYASSGILGIVGASIVISELIATSILRKRVIPPCVRVDPREDRIVMIIGFCLISGFSIFLLVTRRPSSWAILNSAIVPVYIITLVVLRLFEKTEICRNGVLQCGRLYPWEDYESFSWKWNRDHRVELTLVSKSRVNRVTRLMVLPEDRETVHRILEEHLPDRSSGAEDRNA
jgi:hypothetical protein